MRNLEHDAQKSAWQYERLYGYQERAWNNARYMSDDDVANPTPDESRLARPVEPAEDSFGYEADMATPDEQKPEPSVKIVTSREPHPWENKRFQASEGSRSFSGTVLLNRGMVIEGEFPNVVAFQSEPFGPDARPAMMPEVNPTVEIQGIRQKRMAVTVLTPHQ